MIRITLTALQITVFLLLMKIGIITCGLVQKTEVYLFIIQKKKLLKIMYMMSLTTQASAVILFMLFAAIQKVICGWGALQEVLIF